MMRPHHNDDDVPSREEQASEWCIRFASGSLSPAEQAMFNAWASEDPANTSAFNRANAVWQDLDAVSDAPEIISQRVDALDALRRANRSRWSRRLATHWQWPLAIAASLVLILSCSVWFFGSRPTVYATGVGERRALILADGSRLSLDAETKVAVLYESDHRELTLLSGRAKFDVAKDPKRPFTVTAENRTVIATGTAFSVELLGKQIHVIVYEGRVAVVAGAVPPPRDLLRIKEHPGNAAADVTPGRELIADMVPTVSPQIMQVDEAQSLSWEGGQLNFVDEPLASAVERLNRYNSDKIIIGDSRTAAIQVNGVFNAGNAADFVEGISEAYSVRVRREGGKLILTSNAS